MTDKGHASKSNRDACFERGVVPTMPYRSNAENRPKFFPKVLYQGRTRIKQVIGEPKRFRRLAMRGETTKASFEFFVSFAGTMILVKSVHWA